MTRLADGGGSEPGYSRRRWDLRGAEAVPHETLTDGRRARGESVPPSTSGGTREETFVSTFLNPFDGMWRRAPADYKKAVRTYRIAIDTNVLLELYRFTPQARKELLNVLRGLRERLWVPHQVAEEFYARRITAVKEHLALYTSVPGALEDHRKKVMQELHTFAKRCSMSSEEKQRLIEPMEKAFADVTSEIGGHRDAFDLTLEIVIDSDPVLVELGTILDGKTGEPFGPEERLTLIDEATRRADEKLPPGYKDAAKSENAHGDYFVWEQLLRESELTSAPLLFVTNDAKDDWVRREAGMVVGARPELCAEFTARCDQDFMITQLGSFLQIAKEELGAAVSQSTMEQAENASESAPPADRLRAIVSARFGDNYSALDSQIRQHFEERRPSKSPIDKALEQAILGVGHTHAEMPSNAHVNDYLTYRLLGPAGQRYRDDPPADPPPPATAPPNARSDTTRAALTALLEHLARLHELRESLAFNLHSCEEANRTVDSVSYARLRPREIEESIRHAQAQIRHLQQTMSETLEDPGP